MLKKYARKLYLVGLGLRVIAKIPGVYQKAVSLWLVQDAKELPTDPPKTSAYFFTGVCKLCTLPLDIVEMLDLDRD